MIQKNQELILQNLEKLNLLDGDPEMFLNVCQILGLLVPHAAALGDRKRYR